jgi:hypothetical protein
VRRGGVARGSADKRWGAGLDGGAFGGREEPRGGSGRRKRKRGGGAGWDELGLRLK